MGRASVDAFLEVASEDVALDWHMKSNLYPPPPAMMIPVARIAIDRVNAGDQTNVQLPEGVEHRSGATEISPWHIVEAFRLEAFIRDDEEMS